MVSAHVAMATILDSADIEVAIIALSAIGQS